MNFGSTTKRFDTISSGTSRETLESQLERDRKEQEVERQKQAKNSKKRQQPKASSMFASSTSRAHQTQQATGPSPGDYEIQRSWIASVAQGAFKSGIELFVLGPGSYSTERLEQKPLHRARPNVFYAAVRVVIHLHLVLSIARGSHH
ncbi:Sperm-tail PG-rich repeat-containing protein 2 [Phytophthora pseudosyringae]|uniref:Sperm-tail PG-rich repeat-containing protein 2 n=1 Tax=Phytophthora pseudosyringae TaxID=221518 RepID=A0A8T1V9Y0_9STRA|nr:Sperm-tail PG-rich repeat-containing protein 2 [Phytophthora pseudosyringae]